jgi:hypothetical protein
LAAFSSAREVMRVLFAYPRSAPLRPYEGAHLPLISSELQAYSTPSTFVLEQDPKRADLIILLQSAQYKTASYIQILERDPLVRNHAERVYVIDYDDHPEGFLAGLYTSIERPFFTPDLHCSWPMLFMNNPLVHELTRDEIFEHAPTRLFSFIGAASHSVRRKLFELYASPSPDYLVAEHDKWYNHDDHDRRRFITSALDSLFCLCPRGYASYTNRICEIMAMGRVPVIIADDWIPFSFAESLPYYVRVGEREIGQLYDILATRRSNADELRRNARMLWEKYCSKGRRVVAAVERIAKLSTSPTRKPSFTDYRSLWHSKAFLTNAGWNLRQRAALRIEQRVRRWFPTARIPGVTDLMRSRNAQMFK